MSYKEPTDVYKSGGKLAECDICGFTYRKNELRRQRGKLVCPQDFDTQQQVMERRK